MRPTTTTAVAAITRFSLVVRFLRSAPLPERPAGSSDVLSDRSSVCNALAPYPLSVDGDRTPVVIDCRANGAPTP